MPNNLDLIDQYITRRQKSKRDLLLMVIISGLLMNRYNLTNTAAYFVNASTNLVGNTTGYATSGYLNQQEGYYLISRCAAEKYFNAHVFNGLHISNFNFSIRYPASLRSNRPGSIRYMITRLRDLYADLQRQDDTHYYYDIGFPDHTFLIVKYNNNFRLIQSWMLKYQLENLKFDDDIHYNLPRFFILLLLYTSYVCIRQSYNIIQLIRNIFICNNIQAKEYLKEFKFLYQMIFSKELHLTNDTFNLYIELGSENYLCPNNAVVRNSNFYISKYSFNPQRVMGTYQTLYNDVIVNRNYFGNFPNVYRFFINRIGRKNRYTLANNNSTVNIPDGIKEIVNYNVYPYVKKDHNYDSLLLSYILSNYNIKIDTDSYLEYLIATALKKRVRDNLLVRLHNTRPIRSPEQTILSIYENNQMQYFGGEGFKNDVKTVNKNDPTKKMLNLLKLNEKEEYDEKEDDKKSEEIEVKLMNNLIKLSNLAKLKDNSNKPEKIEYLELYSKFNTSMNTLEKLIKSGNIYQEFSDSDFNKKIDSDSMANLKKLYLTLKTRICIHIKDYVRANLDSVFGSLDTTKQHALVIKWFLTKPEFTQIMSSIITNSRTEFFSFLSENVFGQDEIIEGFYDESTKEQIRILNNFDLVKFISDNKEKILSATNTIQIPSSDSISKIEAYEQELFDISLDKFSNQVITKYVLPLISSNTTSDKFDSLLALSMFNAENAGKKYTSELLDSEVIMFGSLKNSK